MFALKLLTALESGLIAGVFFAFSTFLMQALAQPPAQGNCFLSPFDKI
jgi:uncharacterized membrane protein